MKQLELHKYWRYWIYTFIILYSAGDNISHIDMANILLQCNREQLLDLRSAPRGTIFLNKETLSVLKEYNLLNYRGKRAGRPRAKTNTGIDLQI